MELTGDESNQYTFRGGETGNCSMFKLKAEHQESRLLINVFGHEIALWIIEYILAYPSIN